MIIYYIYTLHNYLLLVWMKSRSWVRKRRLSVAEEETRRGNEM